MRNLRTRPVAVHVGGEAPGLLDQLVVQALEAERRQGGLHARVLGEHLPEDPLGRPWTGPPGRAQARGQAAGCQVQQALDLGQGIAGGAALGLAAARPPVAQSGRADRMAPLDESPVQPGQAHAAMRQRLGERLGEPGASHVVRSPPDA
jgi:hypothetical protein